MPSDKSVRVDDGVYTSQESVSSGVYTHASKKKHARIPPEVGSDPKLKDRDIRVFYALALFERGGNVTAGVRYIAECCHVPPNKVCDSLRRLKEYGHIERADTARGKRSEIKLLSPIYGRASQTEQKRCARCSVVAFKLSTKTGWCRACHQRVNDERLLRQTLTIIGENAKRRQVIAHLVTLPLGRNRHQVAQRIAGLLTEQRKTA